METEPFGKGVPMPDAGELYEIDSGVEVLGGAVLLHHLDGFVDAGSAGRGVAGHLTGELGGEVVARFDVDRLLDYRSRRPPMVYATDHWAEYEAPELAVRLLHDRDETPFLLLTGPEPDREWELVTAAVRNLVERWDVRLTVGFHGIPMGTPHTRPLGVTAHATRPDLVGGYRPLFDRMQIPGSLAALLELRLGQAGHDAMGFAAHVPHYLVQSTYPAAGLALLDSIERATTLNLPREALQDAAREADEEIGRQVADSDEVADVVRALERQYDAFAAASENGDNLLADSGELPTAEELGSEFERFLAERDSRE